jgi:glycosyltransferase involved in cell wall biosynthesis
MPTYNTRESHLREAIQSVLNQTFTDFEFLILDDGSASAAQIRDIALAFNDQRIKFSASEKNLGIALARNKLIEMARGEYLAVQDHDDISLPERLRKEVDFLDQHPEVGVVSCAFMNFPRGKIVRSPEDHESIEEMLTLDCVVHHSGAMIRKRVLEETGIFYEAEYCPSADWALWCRLIGKTRFANLTDVLAHYRDHPGNTSHLQPRNMRLSISRIMAYVRSNHPDLLHCAQWRVITEKRYRLLGIIPLMTVRTQNKKTNYLLFGFLRILKCNASNDLSGRRMGSK